jgi:hypothetical protein
LREAGMLLAESNAQAVRLAASIASPLAASAPASRVGGMA